VSDRPWPAQTAPAETVHPGGIANFGWVQAGQLARGEQPRSECGGYAALRELGLTSVLCLREASERENMVAGRPFPPFRLEDEAAQCEKHHLRLVHVPLPDRTVPPADALSQALEWLEEALGRGEAVYVHCMAGIGRTGLVAASWRLAQGNSGDQVAEEFIRYWLEFGEREDRLLGPQSNGILERYGFQAQWWCLHRLAEMSGSPVRESFLDGREQAPEQAESWLAQAAEALMPRISRSRRGFSAR